MTRRLTYRIRACTSCCTRGLPGPRRSRPGPRRGRGPSAAPGRTFRRNSPRADLAEQPDPREPRRERDRCAREAGDPAEPQTRAAGRRRLVAKLELVAAGGNAGSEGFVAAEIVKSRQNRGLPRDLYFFRDEQGLEVDFVTVGAGGGERRPSGPARRPRAANPRTEEAARRRLAR